MSFGDALRRADLAGPLGMEGQPAFRRVRRRASGRLGDRAVSARTDATGRGSSSKTAPKGTGAGRARVRIGGGWAGLVSTARRLPRLLVGLLARRFPPRPSGVLSRPSVTPDGRATHPDGPAQKTGRSIPGSGPGGTSRTIGWGFWMVGPPPGRTHLGPFGSGATDGWGQVRQRPGHKRTLSRGNENDNPHDPGGAATRRSGCRYSSTSGRLPTRRSRRLTAGWFRPVIAASDNDHLNHGPNQAGLPRGRTGVPNQLADRLPAGRIVALRDRGLSLRAELRPKEGEWSGWRESNPPINSFGRLHPALPLCYQTPGPVVRPSDPPSQSPGTPSGPESTTDCLGALRHGPKHTQTDVPHAWVAGRARRSPALASALGLLPASGGRRPAGWTFNLRPPEMC